MDNILVKTIFLPLIAGFVLLFLPNRIRLLSKGLTLVISVLTFVFAIRIFNLGQISYSWSVFEIDNLKLDLLLTTTPLASFILIFAMGFGLLITLYSLKSVGPEVKRANEYYGAILLTMAAQQAFCFLTIYCFC